MTSAPRDLCPDPELVTALVDGELGGAAREDVRAHLSTCDQCRALADAERRTKSAVHALPNEPVPADLMARLLATPVLAASLDDGPSGRPTGPGAPAGPAAPLEPASRRRRGPALLGAAASVAVFMVGAFAFIGASAQQNAPSTPAGTTAIVPAADRLTLEHAATTSQAGLGGPDISTVSIAIPPTATPTAAAGAP